MKPASFSYLTTMIFKIAGGLFLIDGISLLWRGGVGILFLFHEQFSMGFLLVFLLHTIISGAIYTYFGFCLLREKMWIRRVPGWLIAFSAFFWAFPSFGDYFTAATGGIYFFGLFLPGFLKSKDLQG
jgi:hypothetical protein